MLLREPGAPWLGTIREARVRKGSNNCARRRSGQARAIEGRAFPRHLLKPGASGVRRQVRLAPRPAHAVAAKAAAPEIANAAMSAYMVPSKR